MDFFERQARAQRTSRFLLVAFAAAFAAVVLATTLLAGIAVRLYSPNDTPFLASASLGEWALEHVGLLAAIAAGTLALMILASFYRAASLAGGGGKVARLLGGTEVSHDVQDLPRRRLMNVVEEMAIASGLPVPEVYVLEEEGGINAFAAGRTPSDAAIAVTRGTLERLDRTELQGVIAHELSHIVHGDMRLNQQLIGFSFGILVLSLIGRWLLHASYLGGRTRSRRGGASAAMLLGFGFFAIGSIGLLLSRLIKAAVSRERERLADASAVQFTRDNEGLASALKKIGGFTARLKSAETEEVSHMLFERGLPSLRGLFATHPPLGERIRALDPSFDPRSLKRMRAAAASEGAASALAPETDEGPDEGARAAPLAGRDAPAATAAGPARADEADPAGRTGPAAGAAGRAAAATGEDPSRLLARAGELGSPELGAGLRAALPAEIYDAAHSRETSLLLVLALGFSADPQVRAAQRGLLDAQLGSRRAARCEALAARIVELDPALRLPILELALPALKQRPSEQLEFLFELAGKLAESGGEPALFNYVLLRVLAGYLTDLPGRRLALEPRSTLSARAACATLLAVAAAYGHADPKIAHAAYRAGCAAIGGRLPYPGARVAAMRDLARLDAALARLARLPPRGKKKVLEAVLATIRHDRRVGVEEAELFRAIAATLGCPVPWNALAGSDPGAHEPGPASADPTETNVAAAP